MKKQISYEAAFNFGFSSFINHIFTFFMLWVSSLAIIAVALLLGLLCWIPYAFFLGLSNALPLTISLFTTPFGFLCSSGVLSFAVLLFYGFYHYQLVRFSLAIYEGNPLPWREFFVFPRSFFSFCIARLIRWLLICLGCILVVPALYWACKYYFAGYSLIDETSSTIADDRASIRNLTKGVRWQLLGFLIIIYLLSMLISLTLMFAMPIVYLASTHAYKQLKEQETSIEVTSSQN